jgi:hypothetical protein
MDDSQFIIEIDDGVNKLFEDDGGFILLQETVLFGVLEEISFTEDLSYDVDMGLCFKLRNEFDYVGVMALLEDPGLSLQDFLLSY